MPKPISYYIRKEQFVKPLWLEKEKGLLHTGLYTVMCNAGSTYWCVSFNGNSKQRRQQQRKMIRELNQ